MKRSFLFLVGLFCLGQAVFADSVKIVVDVAPADPNAYQTWRSEAFDAISQNPASAGNMAHGAFAGQKLYDVDEVIVGDSPDYGSRLHWVFWIPDETIDSLTDRFAARTEYDWDTYAYSGLDGNGWVMPAGWVDWENRSGGVVGTFGDAFWANQNGNGVGHAYGQMNALQNSILKYNTYWLGEIAVLDTNTQAWDFNGVEARLAPSPSAVPSPLTASSVLVILSVFGAGRWAARRKVSA